MTETNQKTESQPSTKFRKIVTGGSLIAFTVLLLAPLSANAQVTKAAARHGPPPHKKWKMVWHDEFEGTAVDTQRWQIKEGGKKWEWPGFETRYAADNCALDGKGNLVLRLTQDSDGTIRFHQGLDSLTFQQAYGYFETRVQFSRQPGWWTAVWLSGVPYNEGSDTFVSPQEFDIFEDFYKPKTKNDISHCYHATSGLTTVTDQGDGKGIGGASMLARREVGRVSKGKVVTLEEYGGWHTVGFEWTPLEHVFYVDGQETLRQSYREVPVTTVPQRVRISACLRTPKQLKKDGGKKPFYGWLEDAKFPDQLVVDYVRVYQEDTGDKTAPTVTLTREDKPEELTKGQPLTFRIRATDKDGRIQSVHLFAKGYLRAESNADRALIDQVFTVSNLFDGNNTIIAMARDNDGLIGLSAPLSVTLPKNINPVPEKKSAPKVTP